MRMASEISELWQLFSFLGIATMVAVLFLIFVVAMPLGIIGYYMATINHIKQGIANSQSCLPLAGIDNTHRNGEGH